MVFSWCPCVPQVLGESMAGISQNAKNSKLPEFGESISAASKALCGLTEAAAQVRCARSQPHPSHPVLGAFSCPGASPHCLSFIRRLPTWWEFQIPTARRDSRAW